MPFFKLLFFIINLFYSLAWADTSGFVLDLKKDALPEKIKSELGQIISNTSEIDSKIIGAIFICKPYCKFLQFCF